ncbi:short-wave-sensitive opsin 1 [Biomphalaria pfeifferi]|uniref:Short-wave-sensitive opsin 1 n=1 Tax=Biomphalaria pfeifferi TaxID=112525 RepID=A0AAD8BQJ6_BIOPF|nr:short-wave-sensitive opsin 1 [Biomphalaria pfeifferi]
MDMNTTNAVVLVQGTAANHKYISDELLAVVSVVIKSALYDGISGFGVVTNAICLKVFWTMGFKDTINVSFFAITFADMGCLLSLLWMGICYNPLFADSDIPMDSRSVQYLTGGWPKFYFTRVSGMITAYVTFERCLCTTIPLKVKVVLTPERVATIHVLLYVIIALSIVPIYVSTRLSWRWYPSRNASLVSLKFISNKETINIITNSLNALLYNVSFVFVVVCTAILILKLNASRKWKEHSTRKVDSQESSKESRATRRVMFIAILYIVCNLPGSLVSLAMTAFPEFNAGESQQNLFFFVAAFMHCVEAINASSNIFIYLKTGSKFVKIFMQTFRCRPKK